MGNTRIVTEAILRRLQTPRGSLFYSPSYGTDVRLYVGDAFSATRVFALQAAIESESLQDERVLTAQAQVAFNQQTQTLILHINGTTADGNFTLVLGVTAMTLTILKQ